MSGVHYILFFFLLQMVTLEVKTYVYLVANSSSKTGGPNWYPRKFYAYRHILIHNIILFNNRLKLMKGYMNPSIINLQQRHWVLEPKQNGLHPHDITQEWKLETRFYCIFDITSPTFCNVTYMYYTFYVCAIQI